MSMRDWVIMAVPAAIIAYWLVYPAQFYAFANWLTKLVN
jgi:hypothetical protein